MTEESETWKKSDSTADVEPYSSLAIRAGSSATTSRDNVASSSDTRVTIPVECERRDLHDLHFLNPDYDAHKDDEDTYLLDIIAVHGINGDAFKT